MDKISLEVNKEKVEKLSENKTLMQQKLQELTTSSSDSALREAKMEKLSGEIRIIEEQTTALKAATTGECINELYSILGLHDPFIVTTRI